MQAKIENVIILKDYPPSLPQITCIYHIWNLWLCQYIKYWAVSPKKIYFMEKKNVTLFYDDTGFEPARVIFFFLDNQKNDDLS